MSNVVPLKEPTAAQQVRLEAYHEGVPALVTGLCLLGYRTDQELADALGVDLGTWKTWRKFHADLDRAIWTGSTGATALVAQALYKRATGYDTVVKEIQWVRGTATQVTRTEHVPADPRACVAFLGLCGVTPDRPLPGLIPMVEKNPHGKPQVDGNIVGQQLLAQVEAVLTRAVDASEQEHAPPAPAHEGDVDPEAEVE